MNFTARLLSLSAITLLAITVQQIAKLKLADAAGIDRSQMSLTSKPAANHRPAYTFNCTTIGSGAFVGGTSMNVAGGASAGVLSGQNNQACDQQSGVGTGMNNIVFENGSTGAQASFIAGGLENDIASGESFIGAGKENTVTSGSTYSFVGAGLSNYLNSSNSFIGSGYLNTMTGLYGLIGSGHNNMVSGQDAAVAAGYGNTATQESGFVGAGEGNTISASFGVIGGGFDDSVSANDGVVVGGYKNSVSATAGFIGGGENNSNSGIQSVIVGGGSNDAGGTFSAIGGGYKNSTRNGYAVVAGGSANIAGQYGTVGGGAGNTAYGYVATVPGGYHNEALGQTSFAAGYGSEALQAGTFVWSDSTNSAHLASSAANQFLARASGGVKFFSNAAMTIGVSLAPGGGSWASLSDRNLKRDVAPLDDSAILEKVVSLPISSWSYASEKGVRHIGPMAQDFYASFRVGEDDRHITTIDEDGVALAAVKGLHAENVDLRYTLNSRTASLTLQNDLLRHKLARLESEVMSLARLVKQGSK